jgi:hypothetical protein
MTFDPSLSTGLNCCFLFRRKIKCGRELKLISEITGELRDVLHARGLGLRGEIPDPQVLDHVLAKRGHDALLAQGSGNHLATPDARHDMRVL